jgi:YVTN family beta-propeller protein
MPSINCKGSRTLWRQGFVALWTTVMMGLGAIAWSSEAMALTGQPLAYVTLGEAFTVLVIDTGDNTVVNTIQVGPAPFGVAWRQTGNTFTSC